MEGIAGENVSAGSWGVKDRYLDVGKHTEDHVGRCRLFRNHLGCAQIAVHEAHLRVLVGDQPASLLVPDKQGVVIFRVGLVKGVEGVAADIACIVRECALIVSRDGMALYPSHRSWAANQ